MEVAARVGSEEHDSLWIQLLNYQLKCASKRRLDLGVLADVVLQD